MQTAPRQDYSLAELNREATIGAMGTTVAREVPKIDLSDFANRKHEIADQLWAASVDIGFFQLVNHGIPQAQIDEAFDMTASFFDLPMDAKAKMPLLKGTNAGWEYKAQVRPSTGTADNKESYQITLPRMENLWPDAHDLPGFFANDERGAQIPGFISQIRETLQHDLQQLQEEAIHLRNKISTINDAITTQQQYAKTGLFMEEVNLPLVIEDAISLQKGSITRHDMTIIKNFVWH